MVYFLLIIFGLLPSFIWLLFYLRKDAHPESNRQIIRIFFYGILIVIPAILLELGFFSLISKFVDKLGEIEVIIPPLLISILYIFIGVALVEEVLKYLVVRYKVLNNPECDEPLDVMLYMIISALGFAALENILFLFPAGPHFSIGEVLIISFSRFVGATFLHALSSGIVGYFLALSIFETKKRVRLLVSGLSLATLLHGLYNFSILKVEGNLRLLILIIILITLAFIVSLGFKKLKKIESICKIK